MHKSYSNASWWRTQRTKMATEHKPWKVSKPYYASWRKMPLIILSLDKQDIICPFSHVQLILMYFSHLLMKDLLQLYEIFLFMNKPSSSWAWFKPQSTNTLEIVGPNFSTVRIIRSRTYLRLCIGLFDTNQILRPASLFKL